VLYRFSSYPSAESSLREQKKLIQKAALKKLKGAEGKKSELPPSKLGGIKGSEMEA
jgi:hypothetical protein